MRLPSMLHIHSLNIRALQGLQLYPAHAACKPLIQSMSACHEDMCVTGQGLGNAPNDVQPQKSAQLASETTTGEKKRHMEGAESCWRVCSKGLDLGLTRIQCVHESHMHCREFISWKRTRACLDYNQRPGLLLIVDVVPEGVT